ncbi:uncharacterized protein Z519_02378 [Cladophialophora bantiana CBS 173.52]|uniref:Uncharacterized protein n=1 Tax=Cladophialophora bantiana (strain ATCC 10958 / CBS 173.52 / CDC B-1940 / NIH 8579) TaxID=1442370 RepID=A0A0D2GF56_CLAB1|nr:uncharacterized protein Z519_02378 [Cladophialophora bantiana CBS 173.52]KIW96987.1 hypothetical protein Z519_02378 [Cladophialophora bantiana CBS 173.52]
MFATSLEEWLCFTSEMESPLPCLETAPDIRRIPFVLENDRASGTGTGTSDDGQKYDVVLFCHGMYGMRPKHKFIKGALEMLVVRPQGGIVGVLHRDGALDLDGLLCYRMASFPTGVVRVADDNEDADVDKVIRAGRREVCLALGRREETHPDHLLFGSPDLMVAFTQHATALPELTAQVLKHGIGLTVIGGGHSSHCRLPNVVSVDMGAFDKVHILPSGEDGGDSGSDSTSLVVAKGGCKTGSSARAWRLHGLPCDAIVGAVVVSVESSQILCVGRVPSQHQPAGAACPENETDLLWAMKGAGTSFGIVLSDNLDARRKLSGFDKFVAQNLLRNCSTDAYLYWDAGQLHLGVTMFEASTTPLTSEHARPHPQKPFGGRKMISKPWTASLCLRPSYNKDNSNSNNARSDITALDYRPSLIFDNDTIGKEAAKRFAEHYLLPFVHGDLQRLANTVRLVPDFPRPGIEFRNVLGISQQLGGLAL